MTMTNVLRFSRISFLVCSTLLSFQFSCAQRIVTDGSPGSEVKEALLTHSPPRQITFDPWNHELDNNDNFSPDDRFLCYDTRPGEGSIGACRTIEKVEIATGGVTVLYRAPHPVPDQGPGLGAVSYHPHDDRVIFIHGPYTTTGFNYDQAHRFGVSVSGSGEGAAEFADARDVTPPFTPGALRGGTHRHEFDGSGQWVGFTYNDSIMKARGIDLRTIGVTRLKRPVRVDADPRNASGTGFSALVVEVVRDPKPGSDEISRAYGDSWVGVSGYAKGDGKRQLARGFIGKTRDAAGGDVDEVYVVDIPSDISRPGRVGPLEGTEESFPAPCAGASQRRLTWTSQRKYPGCIGIVRSSPDGEWLAFLAKVNEGELEGTQQIYLVSPRPARPESSGDGNADRNAHTMRRLSNWPDGISEGIRWHPSGRTIVATDSSGRLLAISAATGEEFGRARVILEAGDSPPFAHVISRRGDLIAYNRKVKSDAGVYTQIFVVGYSAEPNASAGGTDS